MAEPGYGGPAGCVGSGSGAEPSAMLSGDRLPYKDQAFVGIGDMELGHSVFAVKEISDPIAIFEGLYMLPKRTDARDLDIDLGMPADAVHDFLGVSLLEVDGLAITLDDRVPR